MLFQSVLPMRTPSSWYCKYTTPSVRLPKWQIVKAIPISLPDLSLPKDDYRKAPSRKDSKVLLFWRDGVARAAAREFVF